MGQRDDTQGLLLEVRFRDLLGDVERYIRGQEEHHAKFDFKTEFRGLLSENGIEWDEAYVWG